MATLELSQPSLAALVPMTGRFLAEFKQQELNAASVVLLQAVFGDPLGFNFQS